MTRCSHHGILPEGIGYGKRTERGWSLVARTLDNGEAVWQCDRCHHYFEPRHPLVPVDVRLALVRA
jgi:hypothetical protein